MNKKLIGLFVIPLCCAVLNAVTIQPPFIDSVNPTFGGNATITGTVGITGKTTLTSATFAGKVDGVTSMTCASDTVNGNSYISGGLSVGGDVSPDGRVEIQAAVTDTYSLLVSSANGSTAHLSVNPNTAQTTLTLISDTEANLKDFAPARAGMPYFDSTNLTIVISSGSENGAFVNSGTGAYPTGW